MPLIGKDNIDNAKALNRWEKELLHIDGLIHPFNDFASLYPGVVIKSDPEIIGYYLMPVEPMKIESCYGVN